MTHIGTLAAGAAAPTEVGALTLLEQYHSVIAVAGSSNANNGSCSGTF